MMLPRPSRRRRRARAPASGLLLAACLLLGATAQAGDGRLLGATGIPSLEGSAGGGITTWALLSGYAEAGERSIAGSVTAVSTGEFDVLAGALSASFDNRWELSLSRQQLNLDTLVEQGVASDADLRLDTLGLKYRIGGDPVYGGRGQFSVGAQYKRNADFDLARQAGAERDHGLDWYLAWSRVWIDGPWHRSWVLNATLRASQAHQIGFLGFDSDYRYNGEAALGVFLDPHWLLGVEYRNKPDRLDFAAEEDWADAFLLWMPSRRWHLGLAWVDLGAIGGVDDQQGWYFTVQFHD